MRKLIATGAFGATLLMLHGASAATQTQSDLSVAQTAPTAAMHDYVTFTSTVANNGPDKTDWIGARVVVSKGLDIINQDCGGTFSASANSPCGWTGPYAAGSKVDMTISAQVISAPAYLKVCAYNPNPNQSDPNSANDCATTSVKLLPSLFVTDTDNNTSNPPFVNILVYNFRVPSASRSVSSNGPYGVVHITCYSNGTLVQNIFHRQQTTVIHYNDPFTNNEYDNQELKRIQDPQTPSYPCTSDLGYFSYTGRWHTVATTQHSVDAEA